jgi:3-dehydroquinate synthase
MIGAFHQPRAVVIDTDCLRTLPDRELGRGRCGSDQDGRDQESRLLRMAGGEPRASCSRATPTRSCTRCAELCDPRRPIVAADEREAGRRARACSISAIRSAIAIEAGVGYGEWLHGEAVAAGMMCAARLSERVGGFRRGRRGEVCARYSCEPALPVQAPPLGADPLSRA